MGDLSAKQERFVAEYLIDLNGAAAYRRAGYVATGNAAETGAARLLRNAKVQAAVAAAKAERSEATKIDANWLLTRLAMEAEADLGDIIDEEGGLKPVHEWPLIWRKGLVAGIEVEELWEGRGEDREQIGRLHKVKLSDRIKRLELIGKHIDVQAFKERVEVDAGPSLAAAIAAARRRVTEGKERS